jgi:hypothetical protein
MNTKQQRNYKAKLLLLLLLLLLNVYCSILITPGFVSCARSSVISNSLNNASSSFERLTPESSMSKSLAAV